MRIRTITAATALGLIASLAAWRAVSAGDSAEAAFDSPAVKELAARVRELSVDDTLALVGHVRRSLDAKLLAVPDSAWGRHENLRGRTDAGMARILERGHFDELVTPRGGGAYWSFTRRSNNYNESPQIELQQWAFSSGFYGGTAGLVRRVADGDLGAIDVSSVPAELTLSADEVQQLDHPGASSAPGGGGGRGGAGGGSTRRENPKAEVGGVYAVRAVMPDECDVLAAFEVVAMDKYGATIAWRILKTYDVPANPRKRSK